MSKKPNRLIDEKSPYLRQHAYNPVDWYPWCEEAFSKAEKDSKPVFLSIGYSSCHWCHVMEKESFEDEEIAVMLNSDFVPIKVDKEERPDLDKEFMLALQMFTGRGGWPMTLLLTPDKKPFFADTYLPKLSGFGKIGLLDLLKNISTLWKEKSYKIDSTIKDFEEALSKLDNYKKGNAKIDEMVYEVAFERLRDNYDSYNGGFGKNMKVPTMHNHLFLMVFSCLKKNQVAKDMVGFTLDKMSNGGIWDHLGYGFHRYSTDKEWILPHFEKMLYDQALNTSTYLESYRLLGKKNLLKTAEDTLHYVKNIMKSSEGAFYTSEDADSEGAEGKFYLWTYEELEDLLDKDEMDLLSKYFNIKKEGNFNDEATGKKTNKNILYLKNKMDETSEKRFNNIRKVLLKKRDKRIKPFKDKKILTDWNCLMISSFVKAYLCTGKKEYIETAKKAIDEVYYEKIKKSDLIFHLNNKGYKDIDANLEDYAFLVKSLLDLYQATGEEKYLKSAIKQKEEQDKLFWDHEDGGFFFTSVNAKSVLLRQKEIFDASIPSGNSVSLENILRLDSITGDKKLFKQAEKLLLAFSSDIRRNPENCTYLLKAATCMFYKSIHIVICFDSSNTQNLDLKGIILEINKIYLPNMVLVFKDISDKYSIITKVAPYTKEMDLKDEMITFYLCSGKSCKEPVSDLGEILGLIKKETLIER